MLTARSLKNEERAVQLPVSRLHSLAKFSQFQSVLCHFVVQNAMLPTVKTVILKIPTYASNATLDTLSLHHISAVKVPGL